MTADSTQMTRIRRILLRWAKRHLRRFPWRETNNPYHVFVAEFLLRRTTATAVARVFPRFIEEYHDITALAQADETEIAEGLASLGLQNIRAKQLKRAAVEIVSNHNGVIPRDQDTLCTIPGVGRYIASAIMNFAYGIPTPLVDGNVVHFLRRVLGSDIKDENDQTAYHTMRLLGGRNQDKRLYWAIIDLVAQICLRKRPRCEKCPLNEVCRFLNPDRHEGAT